MKSLNQKKAVNNFAYEFGAMFLLRVVILICLISALVGTSSAVDETWVGWESKPVIVNIQINLEDEGGLQGLDNILSEIEQRNGRATVFITGVFASLHPEVVRGIEARGHEIGIHGWQSGEDLTLLTPDEQAALIQSAFDAVRGAVDGPENVVDFKPQGYRFDADTIQTLQDFGARSISGLFPCAELICQCWYAQSLGKITFPYPITNEFWAVPISDITIDPNDVPLDDAYFGSSADYFDYAIQKYIQQTEAKDPLVIVLHPGITGADEAGIGALSAFLDYVKGDSAKIVTLDSICHFTTYISNFNATGPSEAAVTEAVTIGVTYTSNLYCPHYRFRAYGKYSGQAWKRLDSHCEFVYNGPHSFNLQVTIPAPPGTENTYTIRVVGRGSFGSCSDSDPDWPTYYSYEVHKDLTISVTKPVKIDRIIVTGIPDANNPMTNDPSTAGPEQVQLEAEITKPQGFDVTKVSWSGDIVPGEGNHYRYAADPGSHGDKNVTCTVSYVREATGATGTDTKSTEFELFFRKKGDDNHDPEDKPNWFEYWMRDGAVPNMTGAKYDATSSYFGYMTPAGELYLTPYSADQHYSSAIVLDTYFGKESFGGPTVLGIDCTAEIVAHELYHKWVNDQWESGGSFHAKTDSDKGVPDANYNDKLPDFYETDTSHTKMDDTDTYDLEHKKSSVYKYYGDNEYMAMRTGNVARGTVGNDWANPGKQSNPPYGSTSATSTFLSSSSSEPLQADSYPSLVQAEFTGTSSDEGLDTDGDGLYDQLVIVAEVNVVNGGIFKVVAFLRDNSRQDIAFVNESLVLDPGIQTITLQFSGVAAWEHGMDGPFNVSITLDDEYGNGIDQQDHVTQAYGYTDFQMQAAAFSGMYADQGIDTDGDGLYENLRVVVGIEVAADGNYIIEGGLYDSQGKAIEIAFTYAYLDVGSKLVTLNFSGLLINQNGVDGPYYLRYLSLSGSPQIDFILDAYTSSVYSSGDFETAEFPQTGIAGTVTDYDGFPVLNAFVQVGGAEQDSTFTDANGQYVLFELQPGGYTVTVTPDPYDNLMLASRGVNLSAGQIATVDFVLNPAGSIGGTVTDVNGNPVPDVQLYLSGYETPRFATNDEGEYIIPRLSAGTHTINIDAPGYGPWYILVDGSYIGPKGYSTSVTVSLGQTTGVDFTQQSPPLPDPFAIFTDDQGWISGISYVDGEFRMLERLTDIGRNTWGVAVDYFNDDKHLDFVTGDGETSKLYIFLNDTTGRFTQEHIGTLPSSGWVMDMASADFNKDGNVDFVVSGYNENLHLYSGRGDGTFVYEGTVVTFDESAASLSLATESRAVTYYPAPNQPASSDEHIDDPNATCCQTVTIQSVTPSVTAPGEVVIVRVYHYNSDGAGPNRLRGYVYINGGWVEGTPCTYRGWDRSGTYDYAFEIPYDIMMSGIYTIRFYCYEHGCPSTTSYEGYGDATITIVTDLELIGTTIYNALGIGTPPTNRPPVADAGPDQTVECAYNTEQGTKITLDGDNSNDPDGDPLTYTWTGPFVGSPASGATPTVTLTPGCPDDYVITLIVNDGTLNSNPNEVVVTVQDPVEAMTYDGDTLLSTAGNPTIDVNLIATLRNGGGDVLDIDGARVTFTLTAEGIETIIVDANFQGGLAHVVLTLEPAIYKIDMTLDCSELTPSAILVVYNPEGGFATGGGWIMPEDDLLNTHPNVRANFGFNAKYKQDSPTGHIEFRYSDGYIDLKSYSIEQLVITGGKIVQFKGWASVNKLDGHWFFVKAIDNGEPGTNDTFEIKIWAPGVSEEGDPTDRAGGVLQGGNIVVHTKEK